jgi:hypothetical protein
VDRLVQVVQVLVTMLRLDLVVQVDREVQMQVMVVQVVMVVH